jgi:DNA-binding SARP family transcriptional activator
LRPDVARHVAVVTTASAAATDLTVLVDRQAATLHPVGRVLRPHRHSSETAQLVAELVDPTDPFGVPSLELELEPVAVAVQPPQASAPCAAPRSEVTSALTPGPVDVRLLTVTPRLDGLAEELPPNRARRAVELVAYLALHQPDVVTSDRLRTRVLGSSDADAAAKTLFNTAYAARRAMGTSPDGAPLFPGATRNGLYQLSPEVTVDVQRAATLVTDAKQHDDAQLAMAHYRAALDLVEGEPLANALSGYSWWEAEGHGARIAAVLVDAACGLAALAADAGLFDLARWGLERARLVEPYSEALSRAAMELAAAEGDADRLRLEWRECQRRVDALDPGSSPSSRTESLYGELSRRVLVDASPGVATTDS